MAGMPPSDRSHRLIGYVLGAAALVGTTLVWSGLSIADLLDKVFK
jgi:hypothetical protein